ncbi:hypothetical protein [Mycobacterium lepromatosis]|uniref:hypothetical protein n=1 Tax=Mycobacterium lepromatosis TaxID=480418 RepID=UPI0012E0608F|nr:hypothetical protein [Mycobacterium lepromatosis]
MKSAKLVAFSFEPYPQALLDEDLRMIQNPIAAMDEIVGAYHPDLKPPEARHR